MDVYTRVQDYVRRELDSSVDGYQQTLKAEMGVEAGENVRTVGSGEVLEEFKEVEEVTNIIENVANIYGDQIAVEMAVEKFLYIVAQYQEQPHLLDPHLEVIINRLLDIAKNPDAPNEVMHLAFKLLYMVTKTRGFKVVVRLMPHEVAHVEPVLAMLDKQDPADFETWETRYMLLLWMSMVCMIPFDMSRLDSNARAQGVHGLKPTMDRIIDCGMRYLGVSDKSRDAASYMLSKFMTRHDVREKKLAEFLDFSLRVIQQPSQNTWCLLGILRTLALLFKIGKRDDLLGYADTVLTMVTRPDLDLKSSPNTLVRKLIVKLIQRLGLIFLKPRVVTWRYQRGQRSLADNLGPGSEGREGEGGAPGGEDEDEEYDIPEEVEDVIEHLLNGLKDKDTVIRWSAAKGVGRIVGRLPKELADEVVGSIMEMFTIAEGDTAWHGGCLALAELGRRGLLIPERLADVVPVIIKALKYDQKRGNFSVGAHVRDAACYVCWAFARAYEPEELTPHVNTIASTLVIVSVFDREVNVRRAAAAAFQENVGRQGQFPHGIDILTTCDYFAVGSRTTCYLNLSVFVAQFPQYTKALIDHLVQVKISHWDKYLREIAAEALHNLTVRSPEYMAKQVLPEVITMATSIDVNQRHGAIRAAACITHALWILGNEQDKELKKQVTLEQSTIDGLKEITGKLHLGEMFKGVSGELMREAVCYLIHKLSLSGLPFHEDPVIEVWQDLLDDCLQHQQENIREAAIAAIPSLFTQYYKQPDGTAKPEIQSELLSRYVGKLQSPAEVSRRGYAGALGALPAFMVHGHLGALLTALTASASADTGTRAMAEGRRDAVSAISSICCTVGVVPDGDPNDHVCRKNLSAVYDALFTAMKDYTLDNRGDVGAWIREVAMTGLQDLTSALVKTNPNLLSADICREIFCMLVQQCCEKIDRTRAHAGEIFFTLLYHDPPLPNIPQRDYLTTIFPESRRAGSREVYFWAQPSDTFPKFVRLMRLEEYRYHVLLGMTVSVGGLTESLVKYSAEAMFMYTSEIMHNKENMRTFADALFKVLRDHHRVDRIILPMFKMLDQLFSRGCFNILIEEEGNTFGEDLFKLCKQEVSKSSDPQKLLTSIDVFCSLLICSEEIQKRILFQLMMFLCHRYPIVRKTTASKLYEALVTFDGLVDDEQMEEVMNVLGDTLWDNPVTEIRPIRNSLCDMFSIHRPVAVSKKKTDEKTGDTPATS